MRRVSHIDDDDEDQQDLRRMRGWYTRFGRPAPVRVNVLICLSCLQAASHCGCQKESR